MQQWECMTSAHSPTRRMRVIYAEREEKPDVPIGRSVRTKFVDRSPIVRSKRDIGAVKMVLGMDG